LLPDLYCPLLWARGLTAAQLCKLQLTALPALLNALPLRLSAQKDQKADLIAVAAALCYVCHPACAACGCCCESSVLMLPLKLKRKMICPKLAC